MSADENHESFEDKVRAFARELSRSAERMTQGDVDEIAESIGIDPERARDWADTASRWLRDQVEHFGDDIAAAGRMWQEQSQAWQPGAPHSDERTPAARTPGPRNPDTAEDPLRGAAPHALDMPTDEQGAALAALDSGRWSVEPGSNMLHGHGDGQGPSDALGLVRELHARDWIDASGRITLVGRSALSRWLDAAKRPER